LQGAIKFNALSPQFGQLLAGATPHPGIRLAGLRKVLPNARLEVKATTVEAVQRALENGRHHLD
jgi:hypothetical protein